MSWLKLNDSFNNLKGQLSNLASGVLNETTEDSSDIPNSEKKYEDLEQLIANQAAEIVALRKEKAEFYEQQGVRKNGQIQDDQDKWSWDPPDTSQVETQSLSVVDNSNVNEDLKRKVLDLEVEKRELIASLEQLDIDCQQTTEKVITLKDDLQSQYEDLKIEHENITEERDNLQIENDEKTKSIQQLQNDKANLMKLLKESKKNKQTGNSDELKNRIAELEESNVQLTNRLKEVVHDTQINHEKDVLMKQIEEFNVVLKEYESNHISTRQEYEKLEIILQGYEEQVSNYKTESELLQTENQKLIERENIIVLELSTLKENLDKNREDVFEINKETQRNYVSLLTDSFKKYMDYPLPLETKIPEENAFMSAIETTMKILLDLKWKTETLKKEVDDMTEEKTRILTEKNCEINKLLENSELLSQEVIAKSQALKNYESENLELIKNNDNLINEIEVCKFNTRGLHTISESNEDNLLILESQLEKSNKKNKELEMTITDLENSKQEGTDEVQTELEYIKKQLNLTGTELSQTKNEHQTLLEKHKQLELDHEDLQKEFDEVRNSYDSCYNEKESLNTTVDKIQTEFENTEYKYSEININMETLKEEIETLKKEIESLTKLNKKLEMLNVDYEGKNELSQNEVDDLKQQLTSELEYREQQEMQIRNLSEKLQNAKVSETYFKLQNDTLNRELKTITETRQLLSVKYDSLTENYKEMENYMKKFEEENNNLIEKCKELDEIKQANELLKSNMESFKDFQNQNTELTQKLLTTEEEVLLLKQENESIKSIAEKSDLKENEVKMLHLEKENVDLKKQLSTLTDQLLESSNDKENLKKEFEDSNKIIIEKSNLVNDYTQKVENLEKYIQELTNSRNEMVNFVNAKHQENIQYHNEIQRLNQTLYAETEKSKKLEENLKTIESTKSIDETSIAKINELESELTKLKEEIEKLTDQNDFLRKKSEVLAVNLLEEQSKVQQVIAEKNNAITEKETSLSKELQRLRDHLMEQEEAHTQEMVLSEKRIQEMQSQVSEIEQREKECSTHYTSVNIRTNQHVETLQNQLQMVTNQRDDLRKKMSDAEDQIGKQSAALSNLQFVLEQFQKDREKDIYLETERIRRQINVEKQKQEELHIEITNLKSHLAESKQGLLAASRLSNQVETSKQQVVNMKNEMTKLEEKLKKSDDKYNSVINQTDAKVDKLLIKNLVIGFIGPNSNFSKDQQQILKIIATVLDFNQDDNEKIKLNKTNQGSWLNSILYPQQSNRDPNISQESLSQAFVRFLENESKPWHLPNLLETAPLDSSSSNQNPPKEKPILMSEVVLPTFSNFGQNRNSSSILKDVLKDNH